MVPSPHPRKGNPVRAVHVLLFVVLAGVLVAALFLARASAARGAALEVGDVAPDFTLPDEHGTLHRLSDYRGRRVVLAFYPKDFTPG